MKNIPYFLWEGLDFTSWINLSVQSSESGDHSPAHESPPQGFLNFTNLTSYALY